MKKQNEPPTNYKFENVCSDDSTDNESEKVCPKKGSPPLWSLGTKQFLILTSPVLLNQID